MSKRRQYKNPPIEEAICEVRLDPSSGWDVTLPGRLLGSVEKEYSGKPRQQLETTATAQPGGFTLTPGIVKVQFVSDDLLRLFAVGPQSISVHDLRPYTGWDKFQPRIVRALESYLDITKSLAVHRVGVRYVNRIQVKGDGVDFNEYLNGLPEKVEGLPNALTNVFARFEFEYSDQPIRLVVTCASAEAPSDHLAMILDIDLITEFKDSSLQIGNKKELAKLLEVISKLRDKERDVFESLITDKARELFDA